MEKIKTFCNFCHTYTYSQAGDCVDCGFSKPNQEIKEPEKEQTSLQEPGIVE